MSLDSSSTSFLGISNVSGAHIYRADPLVPGVLNEVKYLNGAGPTFTWTWTPKTSDIGQYAFFAATDDELVYALDVIGVTAPFWVAKDSGISITVGPAAGNWGGTITLSWTGSGQTTSGAASTESGSESVTYVPGMPSPDGMSFDMKATATTFNVTYGFQEETATGACPGKRTYQATGGFNHTGADAEQDAHGLLTVIPNGDSADYAFGVPGLFVNADYTDDVTSDCGTSTHNTGVVLLGATGTGATGTINRDATTISGGTNYQAGDGLFGETMTYTATWNLQKM